MNNFREVNDDIIKEWLEFREKNLLRYTTEEDRKHCIYFDEISANILKNVPKQNKKAVIKILIMKKIKVLHHKSILKAIIIKLINISTIRVTVTPTIHSTCFSRK